MNAPDGRVTSDLLSWSGDRSTIWITPTSPESRAPDILVVDPGAYESRLLFQNPGMPAGAISPDGRWVALHRQSGSVDSDLYLVDPKAASRRLLPHVGMVLHLRLHAGFSARILGSDGAGKFGRAYRYTLADDAVTEELKGDRDVLTTHFSPSGQYRASLQRERPNGDGRHGHDHWRAHRSERRSHGRHQRPGLPYRPNPSTPKNSAQDSL